MKISKVILELEYIELEIIKKILLNSTLSDWKNCGLSDKELKIANSIIVSFIDEN